MGEDDMAVPFVKGLIGIWTLDLRLSALVIRCTSVECRLSSVRAGD